MYIKTHLHAHSLLIWPLPMQINWRLADRNSHEDSSNSQQNNKSDHLNLIWRLMLDHSVILLSSSPNSLNWNQQSAQTCWIHQQLATWIRTFQCFNLNLRARVSLPFTTHLKSSRSQIVLLLLPISYHKSFQRMQIHESQLSTRNDNLRRSITTARVFLEYQSLVKIIHCYLQTERNLRLHA